MYFQVDLFLLSRLAELQKEVWIPELHACVLFRDVKSSVLG